MAQKQTPLDERIKSLRAEIDAFIDARVAQIKKQCPGVPETSLRRDLVRGACPCAVVLEMAQQDKKAEESAA